MRVVVQRVLESLGRAPQSRCDRPPRSHTCVTAHLTPTSISRQNDLTPTTTLWPRRSSVCATPYPSERKDHGGTSAASSTRPSSTSTGFSHRRPRPPKPNASPCLPPPSPPGTPPTSVQLSTTVYQHINLHRRYDVTNTNTPPPGQLRPLTAAQTDAFCTDAGSTPNRTPSQRAVPLSETKRALCGNVRLPGGTPGVDLGVSGEAFLGAGHADEGGAGACPVEVVSYLFDGKCFETVSFIDDDPFGA